MTTSTNRKKARLGLSFALAAAVMCSSATLSMALATLAAQQSATQALA
jgi:hypothetical protein